MSKRIEFIRTVVQMDNSQRRTPGAVISVVSHTSIKLGKPANDNNRKHDGLIFDTDGVCPNKVVARRFPGRDNAIVDFFEAMSILGDFLYAGMDSFDVMNSSIKANHMNVAIQNTIQKMGNPFLQQTEPLAPRLGENHEIPVLHPEDKPKTKPSDPERNV